MIQFLPRRFVNLFWIIQGDPDTILILSNAQIPMWPAIGVGNG